MKNDVIQQTLVTFVLDESGSMRRYRELTREGVKEYIETLQNDDRPTKLKLITFNTSGIKTVLDMEDVMNISSMGRNFYSPSGGTPLLDAVSRGILEMDDYVAGCSEKFNVMFTIMTDGLENASRDFSAFQVAEMIEERETKGWIFTYLGANQNAWAEGQKMGIKSKYASNYQHSNPKEAMRVMAESTIRAKRGWGSARKSERFFTEDEKLRLLLKKDRPTDPYTRRSA